jgi:hypothetical protein
MPWLTLLTTALLLLPPEAEPPRLQAQALASLGVPLGPRSRIPPVPSTEQRAAGITAANRGAMAERLKVACDAGRLLFEARLWQERPADPGDDL